MITKKRFKEKRPISSKIFRTFLGLLILTASIFLIISNFKIYQKRSEIDRRAQDLQQKIQALEKKNQELTAQISRTFSREYLEEVAFEKLNLKPKGAKVGVITPPKETLTLTEKTKKEKNFWNPQNWWEWIKSKMRD